MHHHQSTQFINHRIILNNNRFTIDHKAAKQRHAKILLKQLKCLVLYGFFGFSIPLPFSFVILFSLCAVFPRLFYSVSLSSSLSFSSVLLESFCLTLFASFSFSSYFALLYLITTVSCIEAFIFSFLVTLNEERSNDTHFEFYDNETSKKILGA